MATRLVLLCAGPTAAMRAGRLPDPDAPLDAKGAAMLRALSWDGPAATMVACSPARAARDCAHMLGHHAASEPALRDRALGAWAGHAMKDLDPSALTAWLAAPETRPPGGESMDDVVERVAPWLDALAGTHGRVLAITHAAVVRAALAHGLGLPPAATLAIDVAPLSRTTLSFHDRWRLQELRRA